MHDTLEYFKQDPIHRKYHHSKTHVGCCYSFQENFVLPLSHDEVVHGKGSLIGKMPGSERIASPTCVCYSGYMFAQPERSCCSWRRVWAGGEWAHDSSLEWHVLQYQTHSGMAKLGGQLTALPQRARFARARHQCRGLRWGTATTTSPARFRCAQK